MQSKRKLLAAAALTASLTAGGLAGAMFGAPTISSAQTQPDQDTERAERRAEAGEERAAHGEGEPDERRGRHGPRRLALEAAADALGMTPEELKAELRSGKSVRTVADDRGVDAQAVIDAIVAAVTEHAEERATQFVNRERPAS